MARFKVQPPAYFTIGAHVLIFFFSSQVYLSLLPRYVELEAAV